MSAIKILNVLFHCKAHACREKTQLCHTIVVITHIAKLHITSTNQQNFQKNIARGLSIEKNNLISDLRLMMSEKCSQVNRFEGMSMGISAKGKLTLQKVTSLRLSVVSMGKESQMLRSSIFKNCFATLATRAEGKIINMDEMDD